MSSENRQCILFFTKWPQAGKVKTRLSKDVGAEHGTRLYTLFVVSRLKDHVETKTTKQSKGTKR